MNNINLKIYGVTTVGPKGQVIIPKEARREVDIEVRDILNVVNIDEVAFWIWKGKSVKCAEKKFNKLTIKNYWKVNIWTKYQFVIPSVLRKLLNIDIKDNLIIVWSFNKWLWFIKNDNINFLIEYLKESLNSK